MKVILNQNEPEFITAPINLDRALQEIQKALKADLDWLTRAYGRARLIPEKVNEKTYLLPKVYYGEKEYLNVLLNDTIPAQSWFQAINPETPLDYGPLNRIQKYQSTIALIFWLDLTKSRFNLGDLEDYYHLELHKRDVHNVLNKYPNIEILRVYDENAKDIFREYTTSVDKEQFLTHPRAGLRFEFIITYNYDCEVAP